MSRAIRAAVATCVFVLSIMRAAPAQQVDSVRIGHVFPMAGAWLPTPQTCTVSLQVHYSLKSAAKGRLTITVRRTGENGTHAIAPVQERAVQAGDGEVSLTLPPVKLGDNQAHLEHLRVEVALRDAQGRELAAAGSVNPISGTVRVEGKPTGSKVEAVSLVSCSPPPTQPLKVPGAVDFSVKLRYHAPARGGFLELEFLDNEKMTATSCWHAIVLSVPGSHGEVTVHVSGLYLPAVLAGKHMAVVAQLYLEAGARPKVASILATYSLVRQMEGRP